MAIFARSPKTRIFWKSGTGGPREIFRKSPKKSPRLKGPKGFWRKWHYPLFSMQLKCKDWTKFWRKQQFQKCPNGQGMAILARSPKTRIFWKSGTGGPREIFRKSPKKSPRLKGPKGFWRKWHYPLFSMQLKCKDWTKFWRKQQFQKCPNGQVKAFCARSPKTHIFWKSAKGAPREIFQKSQKK